MTEFKMRMGDCDLEKIGRAVGFLVRNRQAITDAVGTIHTSGSMSDDISTWPQAAQDQVAAFLDGMAIEELAGNTEIGPGQGEAVDDVVKLVFVFEEDGEMVVPLTAKNRLDLGFANPPLEILDYTRSHWNSDKGVD